MDKPVALPAHKQLRPQGDWTSPETYRENLGWNACLDEIAKLGPLYSRLVQGEPVACASIKIRMINGRICATVERFDSDHFTLGELTEVFTHADPGEVERLRSELDEWKKRCQYNAGTAHDVARERDTLHAQLAEAHALLRRAVQAAGDHYLGWDLFNDISDALSASAEPSAPVEIDERAALKPDAWRASINGNWEYFSSYEAALKELREWQSDYLPEEIEEAKSDGLFEPEPVYARAALERKP